MELLRQIRLHRAAELLFASDLPTKRIAGMVGYGSRTYFSRAFKDQHGLTPDGFRRNARQPQSIA
jgi:transcriptional regulator GlxA family with amidase domain